MPDFSPFPGVRYARRDTLESVCAPPYDVIDPDERAHLLDRDPHNSVQLILPESYAGAAATLQEWRRDGVLVTDDEPSLTVYRMTYHDAVGNLRRTAGVIGALGHDGSGTAVLPHERTLAKARSDRLELLRATRANLDPIWGLSLAPGLSSLLGAHGRGTPPMAGMVDDAGVLHEAWRVDDPEAIAALADQVAGAPVVLADGHHRFETARTYAAERAAAGVDDPGAGAVMALIVPLQPEELQVQPIHRLLKGVGVVGLRARLESAFTIEPVPGQSVPGDPSGGVATLERAMSDAGGLGLVDRDGLAVLVPRPELAARMADQPNVLREVDSARFDVGVRPVLGDVTVTFRHDAAAGAAQVAKGDVDAAVLLRAATVEQIRAAADAGVRMPEKTTFFAPKPRTGIVFRLLDA